MTNFELLIVAVICFAAAVWWAMTRTSAAAAPVLLAFIMLTQGVGGPAWEWSRRSEGAGLPPNVGSAPFSESTAVPVFLWAAIGASLSALLIRRTPDMLGTRRADTFVPSHKLSIFVIAMSFVTFTGFVIGQGPSFFRRQVYLQSDGPDLVLRLFWPLGTLFGMIAVALIFAEKDRRLRAGLIVGAALWFLGPLATGSRTALAVPLVAGFFIIFNEISKRRIHPLLIVTAGALLALTVFAFSILLHTRQLPHGLLNLPDVISATITDSLSSTDSFLLPVKQLAASIFVSVPNAEQSVIYGVDPNVLIANANPLPGSAQAMELERYWPYEWVPLSFAGEWYGAFGAFAQVLLFGSVGLVAGHAARNIQMTRYPVLAVIPITYAGIIGVLSIQYSSRMVWRIITTLVLFAFFTFLARRSKRLEASNKRQHQVPVREEAPDREPQLQGAANE